MVTKSDSFGALSFWASAEGYSDESGADVVIEKPPWGPDQVIQIGGVTERRISFLAIVDQASLATVASVHATQAALSCPAHSGQAVLEKWSVDGLWVDGQATVQLTFLVVT